MSKQSLKQKTVSSMIWTSIQRFASMGISFISGIILARLLTPEAFGTIGMLTIFMLVSQSILDGGFGAALIQKKRPTQVDYSTVFWFNLGMSLLLYSILYFSAPFIADFYHMPILCNVLRIEALVLIISAFSIIQINQLKKTFQFRKIAVVTLLTSVISLLVTIWMAYNGYGVWSLVVQGLLTQIIPAVIYWLTNKWYPRIVFSVESFRSLFSFGVYMFLVHVISDICNNIHGLLIGRFYNASIMGYYSKARGTERLASMSISQSLTQITFPLYSEVQDDRLRLVRLIQKLTGVVAFLTFPLMCILILIAKPVFVLLYSDRWLPSVPYFQILCLSGFSQCLQAVNLQSISAIGKSKTMFNWTIVKRVMGLTFVIGGLYLWGVEGLLVGSVLSSWFIYLINAYLVSKHIGYKLLEQLRDLSPILILSFVALVLAYLSTNFLNLDLYIDGIVKMTVFMVIYMGYAMWSKMEVFCFFQELLPIFKSKFKKK